MMTSEELLTAAMWMMIAGGAVGVAGLVSMLGADSRGRGDLSTPMAVVGFGLFFLGAFIDHRWSTFW